MNMNWFIVGLGNPGNEYTKTRHNVGFIVVNFLQSKWGFNDWKKKIFSNAISTSGSLNGNEIKLIKPDTFMNNSGRAVIKYVKTKEDISRLVVVQDDVHILVGKFKISFGRGDGGHNGITSIQQALKTKDFIRIRVGVAPEMSEEQNYKIKLDKFVLENFKKEEKEKLENILEEISKAIEKIIYYGIENAMNEYNK